MISYRFISYSVTYYIIFPICLFSFEFLRFEHYLNFIIELVRFIFRARFSNIYCSKLSVNLLTPQLLEQDQFTCIEKIKTTGSTYMAASGLTETSNFFDLRHVKAVVDYAFEMRRQLECVNQHSWNNFKMKIGRLLFLLKLFCYFPMFSALAECYLYHNIHYSTQSISVRLLLTMMMTITSTIS